MPAETDCHANLFTRCDMSAPEAGTVPGGGVAVVSMRSPAKTTDNEDSAAIIVVDGVRSVLAVADGVGGHAAGAEASRLALEALAESIAKAGPDENDVRIAILNGIEAANEKVEALGVGAATTLALVEIDGRTVRPYHVGDSVILVTGQRGRVKLKTVAHSPVGYAEEAGIIGSAEAMDHEHRHLVSNIVGASDMRIEVGPPVVLSARDTLVIGSDGLMDNLYVDEIVETMRKGPLSKAADRLLAIGHERMVEPRPGRPSKPDDMTFLLFRPDRVSRSQR